MAGCVSVTMSCLVKGNCFVISDIHEVVTKHDNEWPISGQMLAEELHLQDYADVALTDKRRLIAVVSLTTYQVSVLLLCSKLYSNSKFDQSGLRIERLILLATTQDIFITRFEGFFNDKLDGWLVNDWQHFFGQGLSSW